MAKPRMNLPQAFLSSTANIEDSYLAARLSLLNLYTDARCKDEWSSILGRIKNTAKSLFGMRIFTRPPAEEAPPEDPIAITATNDIICKALVKTYNGDKELSKKEAAHAALLANATDEQIEADIKEIQSLKEECYRRSINLIHTLNKYAAEAQKSSSSKSKRVEFYFAILALTQEYLQQRFPAEYALNMDELNKRLADSDKEYYVQHASGQPVTAMCDSVNQTLCELILLGERNHLILGRVFHPHHKVLFPYLSFATPDKISTHMSQLVKQLKIEEGRTNPLTDNESVNANLPLPLQRFFPRILLMVECGYESVDDFLRKALQDKELMQGRTTLQTRHFKMVAPAKQPPEIDHSIGDDSPDATASGANTPPPAARTPASTPTAAVASAAIVPLATAPVNAQNLEVVHQAAETRIVDERGEEEIQDQQEDRGSPGMSLSRSGSPGISN